MSEKLNILKETDEDQKPWYAKGLNFKCTGCGKCCTGAPGYVWVTDDEIAAMADHLNLTPKEFAKRYLRQVHGRLSLREHSKTFDCVFLNGKQCQIYMHRPIQCRTFPWWPLNLKSEEAWKEAAEYCEGIQADAPLVELDQIEEQRLIQEEITPK